MAVLFLACAVSGQNFIQDDPAVAAAKREHFAAFARAAAANGVAWSAPVEQWSNSITQQQGMPVPVADTPEVAAARAAFFAAYNEAARAAASSPDNTWDSAAPAVQQQWSAPAPAPVQQQWSAPVEQTWAATPVNNWSRHATLGVVEVDTPEIAAAKQAFFIAYNAAARAAAESPEN